MRTINFYGEIMYKYRKCTKRLFCVNVWFCVFILGWIYMVMPLTVRATILRPAGGETGERWYRGTTQLIEWDTSRFHGTLTVSIWNHYTGEYFYIATTATAAAGQYVWSIPLTHAVGDKFRVKVQENDAPNHYEMSATFFPISDIPQSILTTVENGGNDSPRQIAIYPNPTEGLLIIQGETVEDVPVRCTLANVLGVTVFSFEDHSGKGMYNRQLNIEHIPTGTYLLTVQAGETRSSVKIVKQ